MSTKRSLHPILIALPLVAFAVTIAALVAHAATGEGVWYRRAMFADLAGLAVAVVATVAGLVDAGNVPSFTVARRASLRYVGFSILGIALFAATATAIARASGDVAPLVLAAVGFAATVIAGLYGRIVVHAFEVHYTTVRYPARMLARTPGRRRPGSAMTIG